MGVWIGGWWIGRWWIFGCVDWRCVGGWMDEKAGGWMSGR